MTQSNFGQSELFSNAWTIELTYKGLISTLEMTYEGEVIASHLEKLNINTLTNGYNKTYRQQKNYKLMGCYRYLTSLPPILQLYHIGYPDPSSTEGSVIHGAIGSKQLLR